MYALAYRYAQTVKVRPASGNLALMLSLLCTRLFYIIICFIVYTYRWIKLYNTEVHLCRVAGNTVRSHMAGDVP